MHDETERGDTLIEILIALTIIGLTIAGFLGGFVGSIAATGQHRSHVTIDAVLKSFAEAAKYDIQLAGNALFNQCATPTTYTVLGSPSPADGPPGTAVTVFGTGYSAGSPLTLTMQPVSGPVLPIPAANVVSGGTSDSTGGVALTFVVPPTWSSGSIIVADGSGHSAKSINLLVVTTGVPILTISPLAKYSLRVTSVQWWIGGTFVPSSSNCSLNRIQQISITVTAQDQTSGTLDFVVINPAFS